MKPTCSLILAVCIAFSLPSWAADDDDPFLINKRDFKKQIKTVALTPIDAPEVFEMPNSVGLMIEEEITQRLQKRGYEVIPSSMLQEIRDTMEIQVGGYEIPETGQKDMARVQAVREHSYREMMFRHQMDAVALIRLSLVRADFENDRAEWHGSSQKVQSKGGGRFKGTIPASSVSLLVFDRSEELLFINSGGLEVLMSREKQQLVRIPVEAYFQDEKRIRKAAQKAVSPL